MLIVLHSGWIVFPRDDKNKSAAEIGRVNTRTRLMSPDELLSCNQKRIRCKWLARYCLSQWDFSQQFKQLFFVKQSLFPQIPGVGWLYWAFSLDEHPSNPPIQTRCMMQVNASQYFTGFHWNYHACLTGSTYSEKKKEKEKSRAFSACVNVSFSRPPPAIWWWKYIPLSGWHGVSHRSYQSFDPAAINNHGAWKKTRLAYSQSH